MIISHNILAMNSNRQLGIVGGEMAKSVQKLSSGYRINRAADDAAGLSISEKMRRQIRGLTKGVENTEDGVSLCQIADGALNEVHDMLQRMNELAVKAANGTNSETDREAINEEISALLTEIDRVGNTTKFNEIYIFKGTERKQIEKWVSVGTSGPQAADPVIVPAPTFDQVELDCELNEGPFTGNSYGGFLKLSVSTVDTDYNQNWPLIFGNGSTSHSGIQVEYISNGTLSSSLYHLETLSSSNYSAQQNGSDKLWQRTFSCTNADGLDLDIVQKVTLHAKETDKQYYTISYNIINNSAFEVSYNFIHQEDTAYDNQDRVESYFLNNSGKVTNFSMYTTNPEYAAYNNTNIHQGMPDSFSIVNEDAALSFTESIVLDSNEGDKADTLIVGQYPNIGDLSDYTEAEINRVLGGDTQRKDIEFGLIWSNKQIAANGGSNTHSFKQGIVALENDSNIPNTVVKAPTIDIGDKGDKLYKVTKNIWGGTNDIWIQSGCDAGDGMMLKIGAMNTGVLDIDDITVLAEWKAREAIERLMLAVSKLSEQRSRIGSYQNRLEHIIKNEENIIENTTAAESKIRDTDMAEEMAVNANLNVLRQAGQSMLAQANQSQQGVLTLLQAAA